MSPDETRVPPVTYLINDIFYTLQGEGYWTGRPAVFVRFSRCNLWTGREEDRATAICRFCDTEFLKGVRYSLGELVKAIDSCWPPRRGGQMVVFTGGEPAIQVNNDLIRAAQAEGFYCAIETNGTMPIPSALDWVCVSPKASTTLVTTIGDELKVVWPQPELNMQHLANLSFEHHWISPMDGPDLPENTQAAIKYVLNDTRWRLNVQTHKVVGLP